MLTIQFNPQPVRIATARTVRNGIGGRDRDGEEKYAKEGGGRRWRIRGGGKIREEADGRGSPDGTNNA